MRGVGITAVCVCLAAFPPRACGWGRDAHKIIGDIAQGLLSSKAKTGALQLLGAQGNLSDVANWADEMTHTDEWGWTEPLHFANIRDPSKRCAVEKEQCTFVYSRDCVDRDGNNPGFCNTGAIANFSHQLREGVAAGKTDNATVDALKFIVHFVADIHQPLHCGLLQDRGGVEINDEYPVKDQGSHWNLHNVWDFGLIVNKEGVEGQRFDLIASIMTQLDTVWKSNATGWRAVTDPNIWTQETLNQATQYAYRFANGTVIPDTPSRHDEIVIGSSLDLYMAKGGVIEQQLATAAVRLAALLETVWN